MVALIIFYGMQLVWNHLSSKQLERFDRVKPSFFKRAGGLHRLSCVPFKLYITICKDPGRRFKLPVAGTYLDFINMGEKDARGQYFV